MLFLDGIKCNNLRLLPKPASSQQVEELEYLFAGSVNYIDGFVRVFLTFYVQNFCCACEQ